MKSIQLICFPYAGGSAYAYKKMEEFLDDSIKLIPIDLPGHGPYFSEQHLESFNLMCDNVYEKIRKYIDQPYAFFGHSMGALIGYQMCKKLNENKLPQPIHCFFSSNRCPSLPLREVGYYLLPDQEFIAKLAKMGGTPELFFKDTELQELFFPIIKADFKAMAQYQYLPSDPIQIPLTIFFGTDDYITLSDAENWAKETICQVKYHEFPGGHFFIFDNYPEIAEIINTTLLQRL